MVPVGILVFAIGLAGSMMNLANLRLVMLTVPEQGRPHYFAVYSVISGLVLGCAPVAWGILLDAWSETTLHFAGLAWNRYTALFAGFLVMFLSTGFTAVFLREPDSVTFRKIVGEVMSNWRVRGWLRFPPRR